MSFSLFLCAQTDQIDSLKKELAKAKHDTDKLYIMIEITEYCELEDMLQYSKDAVAFAEKILKKPEYSSKSSQQVILREKGLGLVNMGFSYSMQGQTDNALLYYKLGLKTHEQAEDTAGIAGALVNIGYIYNYLGKNDEAISSYLKAIKFRELINDSSGVASVFNNLGYVYNDQGNIPKALEMYAKSLKIHEKLGDKRGIGLLLNNIALIYHKQKDINQALIKYNKSLKIMEDLGDKRMIALLLNNIGNIYLDQNGYEKALSSFERSSKICIELNDKKGISLAYNNMGIVYERMKQPNKALELMHKSLDIRRELKEQKGISYSCNGLAVLYFDLKDYKRAYTYADTSLGIAKKSGFIENVRNAEEILSKIDSATGNYKSSLDHYKQFVFYRDSINSETNRKASFRNQLTYEYDKKEAVMKEQQDKERVIAKEKHQRQQVIIWAVVLGLGSVIVFSFFIFRSLQKNKKANKIITLQKIEVERQKEVVEHKNEIIEEKQKEILDSINYAKRIQYTLLAHADFLKENLQEHFVFFNPKDIVSGDFYWAAKKDGRFYLAVCDSTGHGVPGAFMSLLNIGFLSEAINEKDISKPNEVFDYVRQRLTDSISKDGQKDGFDGILVCFDSINKTITYSAAHNAPLLVRNSELIELDADKMPVGVGERKQEFALRTIDYQRGDMLYLYTDGYADQFGGPKGKKFKYKPMNELLVKNALSIMNEQRLVLQTTFNDWRGELEQVDDVCIIGIRL